MATVSLPPPPGTAIAIVLTITDQIAALSGFEDRDLKYTVFLQAMALLVAQPVLLYNADVMKHAVRPLLVLFIPATLLSTPLGQVVSDMVAVEVIQLVGGVLVLLIGLRELYRGSDLIEALCCGNEPDGVAQSKGHEPRMWLTRDSGIAMLTTRQKVPRNTPTMPEMYGQAMSPRLSQWSMSGLAAYHRAPAKTLQASGHSVASFHGGLDTEVFDEDAQVFFMIGSQRSGSNWLRTMLNEREDLAAPHPPHILREFEPILAKFGDIDLAVNAEVLVDHVLLFVERNQVMWTDKHGSRIKFTRIDALHYVLEKMAELREFQVDLSGDLSGIYFLIALLDYCYSSYAQENDKRTYMCKSMGMSKYHPQLLEFFGENRVRYVYLVRDPRDVALSFTKTPVGDCHLYPIITKWCRLQDQVIPIIVNTPELVHRVSYEGLLQDKEAVMAALNEFMGQRSFGKTMRRGSVLELAGVDELTENAKNGAAARNASELSYQFKNLTRGESFSMTQFQKWRTSMSPQAIFMIESLAETTMAKLDYIPSMLFEPGVEPAVYTEEQVLGFLALNRQMVDDMHKTLAAEDPLDAARRVFQKAVLALEPELTDPVVRKAPYPADDTSSGLSASHANKSLEAAAAAAAAAADIAAPAVVDLHERALGSVAGNASDASVPASPPRSPEQLNYPFDWPAEAKKCGYLSSEEVAAGMEADCGEFSLSDRRLVKWAAVCQRGYYPSQKTKPNQDSILLRPTDGGKDRHFFGVYDGHGQAGDLCSQHARDQVPKNFWAARAKPAAPAAAEADDAVQAALERAHIDADGTMDAETAIDDSKSGTTATSLFLQGTNFYVANIGDSKCLLVETDPDNPSEMFATSVSAEHNLYVPSERNRIKECGGKVMTTAQLEGREPMHEAWVQGGEPPRVWASDGTKAPGTAFSRSMGDRRASWLGVIAVPEVECCVVSDGVEKILLMSDGVTEFMPDNEIATVARLFPDPAEACRALVGESYKRWMKQDDRSDDISVIILSIEEPPRRERVKLKVGASLALDMTSPASTIDTPPTVTPTLGDINRSQSYLAAAMVDDATPATALTLTTSQTLFTLGMGFLSGFLGGLCGIRGPPMIIFFMNCPINLSNHQQRATSTVVTFCNVVMRVSYYAAKSAIDPDHNKFDSNDWDIYTSVGMCAVVGSWLGQQYFKRKLADKKDTIKALLSVPLVVCGITLLLS